MTVQCFKEVCGVAVCRNRKEAVEVAEKIGFMHPTFPPAKLGADDDWWLVFASGVTLYLGQDYLSQSQIDYMSRMSTTFSGRVLVTADMVEGENGSIEGVS